MNERTQQLLAWMAKHSPVYGMTEQERMRHILEKAVFEGVLKFLSEMKKDEADNALPKGFAEEQRKLLGISDEEVPAPTRSRDRNEKEREASAMFKMFAEAARPK